MKFKITPIAKKAYAINVKNGFWDKKINEGERLMLVVTEISELLEADRSDRRCWTLSNFEHALISLKSIKKYSSKEAIFLHMDLFERLIKDTMEDEMADIFIRMCDYCVGFKVKIDEKNIHNYLSNNLAHYEYKNLGEELLKITGYVNALFNSTAGKMAVVPVIFAKLIWLSEKLNIDLEKHIEYKMWYNSHRKNKHGKKY